MMRLALLANAESRERESGSDDLITFLRRRLNNTENTTALLSHSGYATPESTARPMHILCLQNPQAMAVPMFKPLPNRLPVLLELLAFPPNRTSNP